MQSASLATIGSASGLLALSGVLGAQAQLITKDERGLHDAEHRGTYVCLACERSEFGVGFMAHLSYIFSYGRLFKEPFSLP